jgi:hypothetical protein
VSNPEVAYTLDMAVDEVLGLLTGMELSYAPELDRYRSITRQLNRALRANALEQEWGYYSSVISLGNVVEGDQVLSLASTKRVRVIGDDAVRLLDDEGRPQVWAYFLPRDALHKYAGVPGLWCSATKTQITFSRPISVDEDGLEVQVPVMREPVMFRLPENPEDPELPLVTVPAEVRNQEIDFDYPDVVILRAAYYVAQSDPVMQPRAQTLESEYKDLMYQIMERDSNNTDTPYQNPFILPVQGTLEPVNFHRHPLSDRG